VATKVAGEITKHAASPPKPKTATTFAAKQRRATELLRQIKSDAEALSASADVLLNRLS
jgi:hypothetical protein